MSFMDVCPVDLKIFFLFLYVSMDLFQARRHRTWPYLCHLFESMHKCLQLRWLQKPILAA